MRINSTWWIFVITLMLMTTGIVMVYSSSAVIAAGKIPTSDVTTETTVDPEAVTRLSTHSSKILQKQAIWAVVAVIGLLIAYHIDYEKYRRLAVPLLIMSFLALLLVFVPGIGISSRGAHRWIGHGGFRLQPSEFAKLALILYIAKKVTDHQAHIKSFFKGFVPSMGILGLFLGVIVIEPDLGSCVVIGAIAYVMWYVGGMRIAHLITCFVLAIPAVVLAIIAEPFRVRRVLSFLEPEKYAQTSGYQLVQSLIAIGTGGISGLGLGKGPQKDLFLSEAYNDFIFAVVCEEMGLIGAAVIVGLYGLFMIQGLRVAARAPDLYGCLLAVGITTMISLQAFINMAVVTGLLPTKGLTLPLISYGGSSLIINMAAIGILMNISRFSEAAAQPSRRLRPAFA